jgi:NAD(P)-dependent dehydrogenase (short-subunit alcohol dehydrogenase family)
VTTVVLAFLAFGESSARSSSSAGAGHRRVFVLSVPVRQVSPGARCVRCQLMSDALEGKVALVAGATRGAGRGTAVALGEAGRDGLLHRAQHAGASLRVRPAETIEETAELVDAAGGRGIASRSTTCSPIACEALVARIDDEHGRLDVLVNDVWGAEKLAEWDTPIWEHDLDAGLRMLRLAIDTHLITSHFALPLLIRRPGGLVVEMTDGTLEYNARTYRLSTFYDLAKTVVLRFAFAQAHELAPHGCTAVALTPGWMRSEMMLEIYGVTEDDWREATVGSPHFVAISETPRFVGARSPPWPPTPMSIAATAARSPPGASPASTASPTRRLQPTAGATSSRSRTPACARSEGYR